MQAPTEENVNTAVGWAIRERRKACHMTQAELALKAEVTRSWLANVEKGRSRCSIWHVYKLAIPLGVAPSSLLPAYEVRYVLPGTAPTTEEA